MTLKIRLAVMMIILLGAVMALQALLMQREQRVLVDRLEAITREIDETTRGFSESTLEIFAEAGSLNVQTIVERVDVRALRGNDLGDDSDFPRIVRDFALGDHPDSNLQVMIFVEDDTTHAQLMASSPEELRRLVESEGSPVIQRFLDRHGDFRALGADRLVWEGGAEPGHDSTGSASWSFESASEGDSTVKLMFRGAVTMDDDGNAPSQMFKVHIPYPATPGVPGGLVELLYPATGIAEELARVRRRSWLWLAGLLGVGAAGAVAMAFQFTRPIRNLESSFGRVVGGDLDVHVRPERKDEIGKLTQSFNLMVAKLREKKQIEERLSEAERLAAVGQLAAGVAHEVRNPLNAMRLTMGQLGDKTAPADGTPEREKFDRYVGLVTSELGRLERLVSTFLDLSRNDSPVRESVEVSVSVRDSLQLFSEEARDEGVELNVDAGDGLRVIGDPSRLPTVWNNLVTNALHAVERGGAIHVILRQDASDVLLEVNDNGAGIDADVLPRVWEPFFSGRADGTGLGLSLVRAIVEGHGGRVDAESKVGEGTRMRVWFPMDGGTQ